MKERVFPLVLFLVVILLSGFFSALSGDQAIIAPDRDVYIVTFGGGEGLNTFIKYDISPVPSGMVIDSVFLRAYVWEVNGTWDGDVMFCNVGDQAWTEADSSRYIIDLPLSDSVLQTSGFGTSTGYTQSVDIIDVFLTDYNASNTFCSIKMKDPDDGTFNPMPGSYPINSADTLGVGNTVFGFHIYFYPSEYANAPPWLVVNYHEVGVDEDQDCKAEIPQTLKISPNPFSTTTHISLTLPGIGYNAKGIELRIYDLSGRLAKSISLTTDHLSVGSDLTPNIYFLKVKGYESVKIVKLR